MTISIHNFQASRQAFFPPIRQTLRFAMVLASLCAFGTTSMAAATDARGSRPNIIFIMLDDMGYGDLGAYGQEWIRMPRVERMAGEGMRHTQAYSGSPVCAPPRSVLMTGRHAGRTTVRGNTSALQGPSGVRCAGGGGGWRIPLRESDVTVADGLKEAGYVTGTAGGSAATASHSHMFQQCNRSGAIF